jgi:hypothetical protein
LSQKADLFADLDAERLYPFATVTGRINDYLATTAPFHDGLTEAAGLKLRWSFAPPWHLADGSEWRSERVGLDHGGHAYPGAIGNGR